MGTLVVVTGASRGFGREAVLALTRRAVAGAASSPAGDRQDALVVVLLSRSADKLALLAQELRALATARLQVHVHVHAVDIGKGTELTACLRQTFESLKGHHFKEALLLNNAGSLGDLSQRTGDLVDFDACQAYLAVNVSSVVVTTALFVRFASAASSSTRIVNISSLLAVQPFPHWGMYAIGKAARDMLHRVVAAEYPAEETTSVKTLNYAPGPLDNDMQAEVRETIGDPEQKGIYSKMHVEGKLVRVADSVGKLLDLLEKDSFESGAHIDYYDI